MVYLFVDSCEQLCLGLLDQNYNWLDYVATDNKKSSGVLHALIEKMVGKIGKEVSDLAGLIYSSGPGSYTGMRVSEGLAQIFSWQGTPIYSFYHFEVPKLLGVKEGCWVNSAFKGELFVDSWNEKKDDYQLIKEGDYEKSEGEVFTGSYDKIEAEKTSKLIKDNSGHLFKIVIENAMKRKPYYYRAIDQEFTRSR